MGSGERDLSGGSGTEPVEGSGSRTERVVLVGFMGSGKTSVGRALASDLGWEFRDFDDEIEAESGRPIPVIFREEGEGAFRRLEVEIGSRLLRRKGTVLATGGGWAAAEGRLEDLPAGTLSVWLKVSAESAVRRAQRDDVERPLLEGADPERRARALLSEREPYYARADLHLDTETALPRELAKEIAETMRKR